MNEYLLNIYNMLDTILSTREKGREWELEIRRTKKAEKNVYLHGDFIPE